MKLKILELFKGTGSFGKVAKKMNLENVSLDNVEKYKPDILTDILKWDYKTFFKHYVPDIIWASPPCNTFGSYAYKFKERNIKTAEPYSERAKLGTKILYKTLQIINYVKKLNPNLIFVIENPRAMMQHDKKIKKFNSSLATYNNYDDLRHKPTNFFNNLPNGLNLLYTPKFEQSYMVRIKDLTQEERYSIPSKLIKSILEQMIHVYMNTNE